MRIVNPPRNIQNIVEPKWTSIKDCYGCGTQLQIDPSDVDKEQSSFVTKYFFDMFEWVTHFWKCNVCSKINSFHSYSYDQYLLDMERYNRLVAFKKTIEEHTPKALIEEVSNEMDHEHINHQELLDITDTQTPPGTPKDKKKKR